MKLTKEQLELWLKEEVTSFKIGPGTKKGDNMGSKILRIEIQTVSQTTTLICKLLPENSPDQLAYGIENKTFWREIQFYKSVAPGIQEWAKEKLEKVSSNNNNNNNHNEMYLELRIPKFYAGVSNNDLNDYLCLEDVRPLGYGMVDKTKSLNYAETAMVIKRLSEFHALSYSYLRARGPKSFFAEEANVPYMAKQWLIPALLLKSPKSLEARAELKRQKLFYSTLYQNVMSLLRKHGKHPNISHVVDKLPGNNNSVPRNAFKIACQTTLGTGVKYFPLLIHGDFWANNLLLYYSDKDGTPEDMRMVDFQVARRGNIYEDLNYFLASGTSLEFRQKHLLEILDLYYDTFVGVLERLESPLPKKFSRTKFLEGYFENILPTFICMNMTVSLQLGKNVTEEEDADWKSHEYTEQLMERVRQSPAAILKLEEVAREIVELGIL